ncbi:hypothetical protein ILUMI_14551, partial [Ignelater luminosus]
MVVPKGCKQVCQTVLSEKGEQVTLVGVVTASEEAFSPVYIFPKVRYEEEFLNVAFLGSIALTIPREYKEKSRKIAAINIKRNLNEATKQKKIQGERSDENEIDEKELCQEPRGSDVDFDVGDEGSEIRLGDFEL